MKMIKSISIVALILITLVAHAQYSKQNEGQMETLEVRLGDIGKCPYGHDFKLEKIDRKYITSALYVYLDSSSKITPIPINDKVFNYGYFRKHIYPDIKNRKVKIKVKKYSIKGKEVYIAYEIE